MLQVLSGVRAGLQGWLGFTVAPLFNTYMCICHVSRFSKVVTISYYVWLSQVADAPCQKELDCETVPTSTFLFHPCRQCKALFDTGMRKMVLKHSVRSILGNSKGDRPLRGQPMGSAAIWLLVWRHFRLQAACHKQCLPLPLLLEVWHLPLLCDFVAKRS